MRRNAQRKLALLLTWGLLLAFAAVLWLVFGFPKTAAAWADQGRALSATEQLAVRLSAGCQSVGFLLLPLLLAGAVVCAIRALVLAREPNDAN